MTGRSVKLSFSLSGRVKLRTPTHLFGPDRDAGHAVPIRISFDRVAAVYDETRNLSPRVLSRVMGVLIDQLQGKRVLEVGVGTGRFAVPLQKSGIEVVGVDISHKMIELGLSKGLRNSVFADGARLPFTPGSFDVATTNHVLHLIPDWRDVLLEIARVTRESYFTILERGAWTDLHRQYDDLVRDAGFVWKPPGLHERELPEIVRPDVVMPVGPFRQVLPTDAVLTELDRRDYSSQWEVPEAIHRKAMTSLREEWAGKQIEKTSALEVTFWRVERIAELAARGPQRS